MDCAVGICGGWEDHTEYELLGILCSLTQRFVEDSPFDIEISHHKTSKIFPPEWSMYYTYNKI